MSFDYVFYLIIKITFLYKTAEGINKEITLSYPVKRIYANGTDSGYTQSRNCLPFYISNPENNYFNVDKKCQYNYEKIWYNKGKIADKKSTKNYREYEYYDAEGNQINEQFYKMILQELKYMFLYHYCNLKKQNKPEMKCVEEHIFNTFISDGFGLEVGNFHLENIDDVHNIIKIETCTELVPFEEW